MTMKKTLKGNGLTLNGDDDALKDDRESDGNTFNCNEEAFDSQTIYRPASAWSHRMKSVSFHTVN